MDKKHVIKIINVLCIIAWIAIAIGVVVIIAVQIGVTPRLEFLSKSILLPILILLAVPTFGKGISLIKNKRRIEPRIWLIAYSTLMSICLVLMIIVGVFSNMKDLPILLNENYSKINYSFEHDVNMNIESDIRVQGIALQITRKSFNQIIAGKEYTFYYLPNSKVVIDIVDEKGVTLLRK